MRVVCGKLSDLKEEILEAKELAVILSEGLNQKVKQLLYQVEYIKDSVTPGYKIAHITDQGPGFPIYFYKTTAGKWTLVETNDNGGLLCTQKAAVAADFTKAFINEECFTKEGTKSTVK